jgi:hypothetical protein
MDEQLEQAVGVKDKDYSYLYREPSPEVMQHLGETRSRLADELAVREFIAWLYEFGPAVDEVTREWMWSAYQARLEEADAEVSPMRGKRVAW